MAIRLGRGWKIGGGVLALLILVLAWAWHDGGERPVSAQISPALLPSVAQ
ncbi:MAG: hypothetical protein ABL914_09750 [Novosphingobium sp.]